MNAVRNALRLVAAVLGILPFRGEPAAKNARRKSRPEGRLFLASMVSSYSVCWQMT
jgi:hypothetical protein